MLNPIVSPSVHQPALSLDIFQPPMSRVQPGLIFNPQRSYPAYSLLVGSCADGLPLLLDLLNPMTGPVLVTGDRASGKTALMQTICRSAAELNGPAEIRPLVIAANPAEWKAIDRSTAYVVPTEDPAAVEKTLIELDALLEQRRESGPDGPAVLLFIDDLTALLELDLSSRVLCHHLLQSGAAARIWSIVSVRSAPALNLHYWINLFHTRLIGSIAAAAARHSLARHPGLPVRQAGSLRFSYWDNAIWRSFWAAQSQDTQQPAI
jgi:hypothetical protein